MELCEGGCNSPYISQYDDGTCKICFGMEAAKIYRDLPAEQKDPTSDWAEQHGFYYTHETCKKGPHLKTLAPSGRKVCTTCNDPRRGEAKRAGLKEYTPMHECKGCGAKAARSVYGNVCSVCGEGNMQRRSKTSLYMEDNPDAIVTKQEAVSLGIKAYRTGKPCRRGHTGWRYLATGACIQCKEGHRTGAFSDDLRVSEITKFMENNPDLIISRKDAIAAGLKVYRDGYECERGHKYYRYVSNGSCIGCLKNLPTSDRAAQERQEWADMRAESIKAQKDAGNYTG